MIRIYLDELTAKAAAEGLNPDALVLGCTHYPLLRPLLERAVPAGMQVIDSAEAAANAAVQLFNGRAAVSQTKINPDLVVSDSGFVTGHDRGTHPVGGSRAAEPAEVLRALAPAESFTGEAQIRCFATDSVEKFERLGSRFLGRPVGQVELVDLGG